MAASRETAVPRHVCLVPVEYRSKEWKPRAVAVMARELSEKELFPAASGGIAGMGDL